MEHGNKVTKRFNQFRPARRKIGETSRVGLVVDMNEVVGKNMIREKFLDDCMRYTTGQVQPYEPLILEKTEDQERISIQEENAASRTPNDEGKKSKRKRLKFPLLNECRGLYENSVLARRAKIVHPSSWTPEDNARMNEDLEALAKVGPNSESSFQIIPPDHQQNRYPSNGETTKAHVIDQEKEDGAVVEMNKEPTDYRQLLSSVFENDSLVSGSQKIDPGPITAQDNVELMIASQLEQGCKDNVLAGPSSNGISKSNNPKGHATTVNDEDSPLVKPRRRSKRNCISDEDRDGQTGLRAETMDMEINPVANPSGVKSRKPRAKKRITKKIKTAINNSKKTQQPKTSNLNKSPEGENSQSQMFRNAVQSAFEAQAVGNQLNPEPFINHQGLDHSANNVEEMPEYHFPELQEQPSQLNYDAVESGNQDTERVDSSKHYQSWGFAEAGQESLEPSTSREKLGMKSTLLDTPGSSVGVVESREEVKGNHEQTPIIGSFLNSIGAVEMPENFESNHERGDRNEFFFSSSASGSNEKSSGILEHTPKEKLSQNPQHHPNIGNFASEMPQTALEANRQFINSHGASWVAQVNPGNADAYPSAHQVLNDRGASVGAADIPGSGRPDGRLLNLICFDASSNARPIFCNRTPLSPLTGYRGAHLYHRAVASSSDVRHIPYLQSYRQENFNSFGQLQKPVMLPTCQTLEGQNLNKCRANYSCGPNFTVQDTGHQGTLSPSRIYQNSFQFLNQAPGVRNGREGNPMDFLPSTFQGPQRSSSESVLDFQRIDNRPNEPFVRPDEIYGYHNRKRDFKLPSNRLTAANPFATIQAHGSHSEGDISSRRLSESQVLSARLLKSISSPSHVYQANISNAHLGSTNLHRCTSSTGPIDQRQIICDLGTRNVYRVVHRPPSPCEY